MKKETRKNPSNSDISDLLLKTRRRCCLCVYLDGDLNRKKVQVAHIDRDRSNSSKENLVPLCLDHHDEYDSRTSQSKGITQHEIQAYKEKLIQEIADGTIQVGGQDIDYSKSSTLSTIIGNDDLYRYGVLFSEISRILYDYDPIRLNFENSNPDEYDAEAHDIIKGLQQSEGQNTERICKDVFTTWFTPELAIKFTRYEEMANDISKEWLHFKANI